MTNHHDSTTSSPNSETMIRHEGLLSSSPKRKVCGRCCCPYNRVDFQQSGGLVCCNYPCFPLRGKTCTLQVTTQSSTSSHKATLSSSAPIDPSMHITSRLIVTGYVPFNLPPLIVTCFSALIPCLPGMLLMNMNVSAWEFEVEDRISGSTLVMYERRKGICCEDRQLLVDCVTKVGVEDIEEFDTTTHKSSLKARLIVSGSNGQHFRPPFSEQVTIQDWKEVADMISLMIPPQHRPATLLEDVTTGVLINSTLKNDLSPGTAVRNQKRINSINSSPAKSIVSLAASPHLAQYPLADLTEPTVEDFDADDGSQTQLPDGQRSQRPPIRYYASSALVADLKTVIPLKQLVDMIRQRLELDPGLVMAAIIAQGNAYVGLSSTGMMKEDAFRIANALGLLEDEF